MSERLANGLPLRLAIIGAGWAGTRQAEAVRELEGRISVVCLVDSSASHLVERSKALGVEKAHTDVDAALNDPEIDAVSICTPHEAHAPMSIASAEAGKHVLVEKPMATNVADASRMIHAASKHGVRLYVAESAVYQPQIQMMRDLVRDKQYIGELTFGAVVAGYRAPDPRYPGRRAWLAQPELGGTGAWMLNGIHAVARCRAVLGEIEAVYAQEHKATSFQRPDLEGTISCLLTMECGVGVWLVHSPETPLHHRASIQLYGDHGYALAFEDGCEVYDEAGAQGRWLEYPEQALSEHAQELLAFWDYIAGRADGPTDGISERRSLAVVEAALQSARSGRPVSLVERFGKL